jgi:type IV pilus assembly protein PilW
MKIYCQTQYVRPRHNVRGLTLIEMMVGLAIGLVIALAAASAYLGTRGAAVATENVSRINETGKLALDFIGTEIRLAGFFPADQPTTLVADMSASGFTAGFFTNIKSGQPVAYNQGFFGCDGAKFQSSTGAGKDTCPAATTGAADSIVLNYFSSDIFGIGTAAITGLMKDCAGARLESDPDNHQDRDLTKTARNLLVPPLPMLVSNRIGLNATNYTAPSGQAFSTFSLSCNGNGNTQGTYQPIFEGIEDLVIRYGVYGGANSQSPERFYTAAEVTALPLNDSKTGWQRVSAVQVCIIVRSLENARLATQSGTGSSTFENCRGGTTAYPAGGSVFKRFTRVFAAKNNLNLSN